MNILRIILSAAIICVISSNCNSRKNDNKTIDPGILPTKIDTSTKIVSTNSNPTLKNDYGFRGCDKAILSHDSERKLYKYSQYLVVVTDSKEYAGQIIKIYQDTSTNKDRMSANIKHLVYSDDGMGTWYFGAKGNYAFLDLGTGPDRVLVVIDLQLGKSVFSTGYSDPISIDSNFVLNYYSMSSIKATKDNHSEYDKYIRSGLTPILEEEYSYNLITKLLTKLGNVRPSALQ